jgi:tetratricopeptide (TPR) repeat protein
MRIAATLAMLGTTAVMALSASDLSSSLRIPDDELDTAARAARLYEAHRFEEAAGLYRIILQEHSECLYAWTQLCLIRLDQGRNAEAREALNHAAALAPKDTNSLYLLGRTEYIMQDYADAARDLQAVVVLDTNDSAPHDLLGRCFEALGRHHEAATEQAKADALERKRAIHSLQDYQLGDKTRNSS